MVNFFFFIGDYSSDPYTAVCAYTPDVSLFLIRQQNMVNRFPSL